MACSQGLRHATVGSQTCSQAHAAVFAGIFRFPTAAQRYRSRIAVEHNEKAPIVPMRDVAGLLFKCLGQSQCQCSHDRLADCSPVASATWRARCAESAPTTVRVCLVATVPLPERLCTQHRLRIRAHSSSPTPATPLSCALRQRAFCVLAQPSQGFCPQHAPAQPDVTCPRAHSLRPAMALVAALWPRRRSRSARRRTPARPAPYSLYT